MPPWRAARDALVARDERLLSGRVHGVLGAVVPDDARPRDDRVGSTDCREQLGERTLGGHGVVVHEPQPVGLVVGERDRHARGEAAGTAGVARQRDEVHEVACRARDVGRVIGRRVVDDDDMSERGALGGESSEHLGEQLGAIVGDDDRDDARWLR